MTCFFPLKGFVAPGRTANDKRNIVFSQKRGYVDLPSIMMACGQCTGCRIERSRQWAMRCVHEASLYDDNCFITLTFEDTHLPDNYSINVEDLQLFFKRLRKKYVPKCPTSDPILKVEFMAKHGIRYFACAEYGDLNRRPHYHAILFNHWFSDVKPFMKSPRGDVLYISDELSKLWLFGYVLIGRMTFESAAYVARYSLKKLTGVDKDKIKEHYTVVHPHTGEVVDTQPEFVVMSRKPGIGKGWYDKFYTDIYPSDRVVIRGKEMRPPKFYDRLLEMEHPLIFDAVKKARVDKAMDYSDNNTADRLHVRHEVLLAKLQQLRRGL